jgi:hypothetical protein
VLLLLLLLEEDEGGDPGLELDDMGGDSRLRAEGALDSPSNGAEPGDRGAFGDPDRCRRARTRALRAWMSTVLSSRTVPSHTGQLQGRRRRYPEDPCAGPRRPFRIAESSSSNIVQKTQILCTIWLITLAHFRF